MNQNKKALFEVNFASFLLAINPLLVKVITLSSSLIVLGRAFFALIALGGYILFFGEGFKMRKKGHYFLIFILGVFLAFHWLALYQAVKVSSVAVAMISNFTFPIMTALIEPFVFKSKFSWSDLFVALIVLLGVVIVVPSFDLNDSIVQGVLWGVLSAFLYSIRNIWMKKKLNDYPGSLLMFYQLCATFVVFLPFLFWEKLTFVPSDWAYLILIGFVLTAFAHTMFVRSLNFFNATVVGVITSVQIIYGILLALLFFQEVPTFRTLAGGGVVFLAVIYETFKHSKNKLINV